MENETVKPGSGCRLSRSPRPALAAAGADRREWHPLRRGPQLPRWSRGSRGAAAEMTSAHPPPPRAIGRVRRCRHESGHATPGLQLPALTAAGLVGPRRHRLVDGGTAQSGGLRSGRRGEECPLADAPPPSPRSSVCSGGASTASMSCRGGPHPTTPGWWDDGGTAQSEDVGRGVPVGPRPPAPPPRGRACATVPPRKGSPHATAATARPHCHRGTHSGGVLPPRRQSRSGRAAAAEPWERGRRGAGRVVGR